MITYLPDDILVKVDRASMAYSLESRTPILDYNIIEFSMTVAHALKYKNGDKKYLLKELTHQYIPKTIMDRPKKGFGVPIEEWLYTDLNYLIEEHLNHTFIIKQNIFELGELKIILDGFENNKNDGYYSKIVWHLIVFQMWYKEYML
jgi:asparagine synthase (glutamine-hydrolysing)